TFDAGQVNFTGHVFGQGATFAGTLQAVTGTFGDVTVTDGDFNLQDKETGNAYSATPRRNLIKDHSFELIQPDPSTMNSSSVTNNWLGIVPNRAPYEDTFWERVGSPNVAVQFAPASKNALAMYGEQAIVVRNAHYVRQYVYEGIGAGSQYTVSAFFKRQWNATGGQPVIQLWHVNALGSRVSRILSQTFPT